MGLAIIRVTLYVLTPRTFKRRRKPHGQVQLQTSTDGYEGLVVTHHRLRHDETVYADGTSDRRA